MIVSPPSGYQHPCYAASLAEFGTPRHLPRSDGWILRRPIAGSDREDATGCYPLFSCFDWSALGEDLRELAGDCVSLALVADPLASREAELRDRFDLVVPFKDHFVIDFDAPRAGIASKHHRYYARKAQAEVQVDLCAAPLDLLDDWERLYATLAERHHISGMRRFSRQSFAAQLQVPGLVAFRAAFEGQTVGAHLWYVGNGAAYSHLAAFSPRGYELMAAYALYAAAIEHFRGKARWLELGAGAGVDARAGDGLAQFKRGWATGSVTAYFCGKIFDVATYDALTARLQAKPSDYFPAYRAGEFG